MRDALASSADAASRSGQRLGDTSPGDAALDVTGPRHWFVEVIALLAILLSGNLLGTALVFVWASLTRTPLASLGFIRPRSIVRTVVFGVAGGIALKLLLKAVILPALGFDAMNPAYRYLTGNHPALWPMLLFVIVGGGFGEETIWRGYLFDRLGTFTRRRAARSPIVILTALLFASAHYAEQGLPGAVQASMTGLTLGTIYVLSGNIWTPMLVHATYDVAALLMIYWNLEWTVAHLLFQ
jgi:membrane protease YdiL (CAAX protease family)